MNFYDYTFFGKSNSAGRLVIVHSDEFNDVLKQNKGKSFVGNLFFMEEATERHRQYYFLYVIPKIAKALYRLGYIKNLDHAEELAREISPVCWDECYTPEGKHQKRLREIAELSDRELALHISFLKMKAASWLKIYINDTFES